MTQTAFLNGKQAAESELKKKQQTQPQPQLQESEPEDGDGALQPKPGTAAMDPNILAAINGLVKSNKELQKQFREMREENARLRREGIEREINTKIIKTISDEGLEAPDSVLLLIRNQCAVDFVPDPSDPNELQVIKHSPDGQSMMPVDGPGTYVTAKEFIKRWANSPEGLRYKRIPEGAKQGAGISGGGGTQQVGEGPLHPNRRAAVMKELGLI